MEKDKPKITIAHFLEGFALGGTEIQAIKLINKLSAEYTVYLCYFNNEGPLRDCVDIAKTKQFKLKKFLHPTTIKQIYLCSSYLRANKVSILHCHNTYANVFGVVAGKLAGVPVIVTTLRDMGDFLSPLFQYVQKIALGLSSHVIVNAEAIKRKAMSFDRLPDAKVSVIYNGVDLPDNFGRTRGADDAPYRIGMIANFNRPIKGHKYFIEAASLIHSMRKDVEFLVAGQGVLRNETEMLARQMGVDQVVNFTGSVRSESLYDHFDVFVCPSLSEGLSNVIIEAMAHGVPVVATEVGGNVELLTKSQGGLLVSSKDSAAIAGAIEKLLDDDDQRLSFGHNGRQFIEEQLSWDKTVARYINLYNNLLERGK
jgi:glycosyltransferase involved in cell wall biosynthesis